MGEFNVRLTGDREGVQLGPGDDLGPGREGVKIGASTNSGSRDHLSVSSGFGAERDGGGSTSVINNVNNVGSASGRRSF